MTASHLTSHAHPQYDYYYYYNGSGFWISSAIFLGIFGLFFFIHLGLAIKSKQKFLIPLVLGVFLEAMAYALRLASSWIYYGDDYASGNIFTAWTVILMCAPFFIRTSIYLTLSRLHAQFTPHTPLLSGLHLLIPILPFFDILPFLLQLFGILILHGRIHPNSGGATYQNGTYVLFASFILQYVPLLVFFAALVAFRRKADKSLREGGIVLISKGSKYKGLVQTLYMVTFLLLIRLTYYTYNAGTDYSWIPSGGTEGWAFKHNDFLMAVIDAPTMIAVVVGLASAHPGRFLRRGDELPRTGWFYNYRAWRGGNAAMLGGRTEVFRLESENRFGVQDGNSGSYRGGYVA